MPQCSHPGCVKLINNEHTLCSMHKALKARAERIASEAEKTVDVADMITSTTKLRLAELEGCYNIHDIKQWLKKWLI